MPVQFKPPSLSQLKANLTQIYNLNPSPRPVTTPRPASQPPPPLPSNLPINKPAPPPTTVTITPLPRQVLPPRGNVNSLGVPIKPFVPEPPPTTNPVPRVAPPPGSGGAAVVTTTAGGVVTGAGLVTGGLTLVAGALVVHNARELYKLFKLSQPEPKAIFQEVPTSESPSTGGQSVGVKYNVTFILYYYNYNSTGEIIERFGPYTIPFWGPIIGFRNLKSQRLPIVYVTSRGYADGNNQVSSLEERLGFQAGTGSFGGYFEFESIVRADGLPDKPPIQNRPPLARSSPTPQGISSPNSKGNVRSPTSPAPVITPVATNNRPPYTITTPGAAPITITAPGANPVVITPSGIPATIKITRPSRSPFVTGNPTTPASTPTGTPTTTPPGVPIAVSSPNAPPTNLIMPGSNPITITYPGQEPIVIDPKNPTKPTGVQAAPIPQTGFVTTPASPTQTPTSPVTTPTTPTKPETTPDNPFADIKDPDLAKLGLGLVGITQLLQGLNTNTTPAAIEKAVCNTTKPGGCNKKMTDNAINTGNEDLKQYLTNQLPNILGNSANAAIGLDTNARVKKIEGDTAKIRESTGSDRYPMVLPEYLLDDFIDKPVQIPDQVAYNVWLLKQIDALVGLFPIKIERTDENGVKQILKFENIAEAVAELTGLLAEIAFDADTSVNVGVHATSEAIGAKVAAIQATSYLKAICEYLGFQGQPTAINVPISCTPGAVGIDDKLQENELEDFLKSSTQKAVGWECKERDDLHSIIKRILFDSEVSRAALYKPLKPEQLTQQTGFTGDAIKKDKIKEKQKDNDEWEAFKTRIKNQEGTGVDVDLEEKSLTDENTL